MAEAPARIRILAQPHALCRERYSSEVDAQRQRAQRFIRADANPSSYDYPTVEVPPYLHCNKRLYIRITPVTVPSTSVRAICVHPYPIDTPTHDVIRDTERNTLFFPITNDDIEAGHKSFRITRKKLVQYDLRNYGPLRLLNSNEHYILLESDSTHARKLTDIYQLGKSQLIFSLAELVPSSPLPIIYDATSSYSTIITGSNPPPQTSIARGSSVICVPNRGSWLGNQEVLMVLSKLDRRKSPKVQFEHPLMNDIGEIKFEYVDTKTILFSTPPCPISFETSETIQVPIVVTQGPEEIARVNFYYQIFKQCETCHANLLFDSSDDSDNVPLPIDNSISMEDYIFES